jgi:ribosomal-protein-alanine N-acetyltransferase
MRKPRDFQSHRLLFRAKLGKVSLKLSMTIQTKNLILTPHLPRHLRALLRGPEEFEKIAGLRVADGIQDQLLSASSDFKTSVENARETDPWRFGFGVIHKIDNVLIGLCGFPGPPDSDGFAEIAYGIAPAYQGKGYATEVAKALIDFASLDARVKRLCAHTLAQINASTRVLEKCGFRKVGEAIDPENNLPIWRWERCHPERSEGSLNRSDRHARKIA